MKTISGFGRRLCIKGTAIRSGAAYASLPLLLLSLLAVPALVRGQSYTDNYGTWTYTSDDGTITITEYAGPGGAVIIPSTIDGLPVTTIGYYISPTIGGPWGAFAGCESLTSVTIPASVTYLGWYAFADCLNLTSVYFLGNVPGYDFHGVFSFFTSPPTETQVFDPVTFYCLPGTDWVGSTMLRNPEVQTSNTSFGVPNQFGFTVTGSSNLVVVIESTTSLANPTWSPLQTNTLSGNPLYFTDPQWTNYPSRFYRVTWP